MDKNRKIKTILAKIIASIFAGLILIVALFVYVPKIAHSIKFSSSGLERTRVRMEKYLEKRYNKKFVVVDVEKALHQDKFTKDYYTVATAYPEDNPNHTFVLSTLSVDNSVIYDDFFTYLIEEEYSSEIIETLSSFYPNSKIDIEISSFSSRSREETDVKKLMECIDMEINIAPQSVLFEDIPRIARNKLEETDETRLIKSKLKEIVEKKDCFASERLSIYIYTSDQEWGVLYYRDRWRH